MFRDCRVFIQLDTQVITFGFNIRYGAKMVNAASMLSGACCNAGHKLVCGKFFSAYISNIIGFVYKVDVGRFSRTSPDAHDVMQVIPVESRKGGYEQFVAFALFQLMGEEDISAVIHGFKFVKGSRQG